ncbi:MAG: hypothetical protein AB7N91_20630 [Candidatus Tectimicrobiota bacterium]
MITGSPQRSFAFTVGRTTYLVLPFATALQATLVGPPGQQFLAVSEALILNQGATFEMLSLGPASWILSLYPVRQPLPLGGIQAIPVPPADPCLPRGSCGSRPSPRR